MVNKVNIVFMSLNFVKQKTQQNIFRISFIRLNNNVLKMYRYILCITQLCDTKKYFVLF